MIALAPTVGTDYLVLQPLVDRMVGEATAIAGGDLATLHTREPVDGLERQILDAVSPLCAELMGVLAGPEAFIQAAPNIRIHRPLDNASPVPFHSDALYGHSIEELNYWICLTPAFDTNSLWMVGQHETEALHAALKRQCLTLTEFEARARRASRPIHSPEPGIHSFCCAQLHGSVLNETDCTRVSIDLRSLGPGCRAGVKNRGGYFRPQWLPETECPVAPGTPMTTVASLDEGTPVYLQRVAMQLFYPQGSHRELVEFHGLPFHAPTLTDAMAHGPVLAYTVRQLREMPRLDHPIGFADERLWVTPERVELLERFMAEVYGTGS